MTDTATNGSEVTDATDERSHTIRPNRRVFIWRPIIRRGLLFAALALAAHFFLPLFAPIDPGLVVWLAAAGAVVGLYGVNRWVTFRRTFYEFHDDRLVVKTGSILTRGTIDLPYRNVTQVVLRLPFIENTLFDTGHLTIHAAGSARGIARLESVDDPHRFYDRIADHLRDNGFSLARNERLQREKPHIVGTALDTSGMAVGGLIALLTIGLTVGGAIIDVMALNNYYELYEVLIGAVEADDPQEAEVAFRGALGLAILAVVAATAGLAKIGIHFVDLNRRTYTLWDDVVDYQDGFLTETYKFVPVENLADTATEVPFLKRLFGMADVTLSPHGSASGIRFPSMPRAEAFRRHLDRLIEQTDGPDHGDIEARPDEAESPTTDERVPQTHSATTRRLPDLQVPPLEFGPSYLRRSLTALGDTLRLLGMLVILLAIGWFAATQGPVELEQLDLPLDELTTELVIIGLVGLGVIHGSWQLVKAVFFCATTDYTVGRRKMSWERDFISRDEIEFTTDKITTLIVERDVLDRLMGTATITFWSIGNKTPLVFNDVADAGPRLDEIRRRLGILNADDQAESEHRPKANPLDVVAARLYSTLFWLVCAAGAGIASMYWPWTVYLAWLFVALPVVRIIRDLVYYPFARMKWFDDHIQLRRGILLITEHYVPYDQLRSVGTTRYPGRPRGTLELVPGSAGRMRLRYLDEIRQLHERLDDRLHTRPMRPVRQPESLDRTVVSRRTPQARNSIVVAGIFTLSVAIVTIIPAILLVVRARRTTIAVEQTRIKEIRGILYRSMRTVLNNRVDQLLMDRGPVHTLFGNGVVSVLTVGSTRPELRLGPIPDEQDLYDEIEARLPGKNE